MTTAPGFVNARIAQIDQVSNLFDIDDFKSNSPLSGEYLLDFIVNALLLQRKVITRLND